MQQRLGAIRRGLPARGGSIHPSCARGRLVHLPAERGAGGQIFSLPESCVLYPAHDYKGLTSSTVGEVPPPGAPARGRAS